MNREWRDLLFVLLIPASLPVIWYFTQSIVDDASIDPGVKIVVRVFPIVIVVFGVMLLTKINNK